MSDTPRSNLLERLRTAQVASCSCHQKHPDWSLHEANCGYRLYAEAEARIMELESGDALAAANAALAEARERVKELESRLMIGYGYLWHVNNEPAAPIPMYSPEKAAYHVRAVLRDTITHEQRGQGIESARKLIAEWREEQSQ